MILIIESPFSSKFYLLIKTFLLGFFRLMLYLKYLDLPTENINDGTN